MGLDLIFNFNEAAKYGAETKAFKQEEEITFHGFKVPGMEYYSSYSSWGDDHISVRANKWGEAYAPITEFLEKHGIPWDEA